MTHPSEHSPWARIVALVGLAVLAVVVYLALPRAEREQSAESGPPEASLAVVIPAATATPLKASPSPLDTGAKTPTPRATLPASPGAATDRTPTEPVAGMVQTTGNVWCRAGPGMYYEAQVAFEAGQQARILGQYEDDRRAYWLVATPDGLRCWLPKRYTVLVQGIADAVPFATPPPPPPVAFLAGIERVSRCRDRYGLTLWLRNEGTLSIESVDIKVEGPEQAYRYTIGLGHHSRLAWWLNCDVGGQLERLLPGEEGYVTVPTGSQDLSGEWVTVTFKACSENHLQGLCLERRLLLPVP